MISSINPPDEYEQTCRYKLSLGESLENEAPIGFSEAVKSAERRDVQEVGRAKRAKASVARFHPK
jgi:hypothetical protein